MAESQLAEELGKDAFKALLGGTGAGTVSGILAAGMFTAATSSPAAPTTTCYSALGAYQCKVWRVMGFEFTSATDAAAILGVPIALVTFVACLVFLLVAHMRSAPAR